MYGTSSSTDGVRVRTWVCRDGSYVAATVLRDGRSLHVCGLVADPPQATTDSLRRDVDRQMALAIAWDRRRP